MDPALVQRYHDDLHLNTLTDYHSPGAMGRFASAIYWTALVIKCTNLMHGVLAYIHAVIPSYGLCIIVLTVLVRGMMFPLSRKQAMMSLRMQQLAPELKKLQEKYKDDRQALGMAQMELYRKHGVNPFGSCWVLLLQMPIFMGLYFALQESIHFRLAEFWPTWITNLAAPDMLFSWSQRIPYISRVEDYGSFFYLGPYFNLLPVIAVALMIVQQKMMTPPPTDEQQAMQQKMMKYMMVFFGLMFYKVAAGLCLYFIASSVWGFCERKLLPKKKPVVGEISTEGYFQKLLRRAQGEQVTPAPVGVTASNGGRLGGKRGKNKRRPGPAHGIGVRVGYRFRTGSMAEASARLVDHRAQGGREEESRLNSRLAATRSGARDSPALRCASRLTGRLMIHEVPPMRILLVIALATLLLAVVPGAAQNTESLQYQVEIDKDETTKGNKVFASFRQRHGKQALYVTVQFKVLRDADGNLATDVDKDDIVIREDGKKVEELEILLPRTALTTVLAMDVSGSMANPSGASGIKKIDEAKKAAGIFLDHLSTKSETGLILFDHLMRVKEPPLRDAGQYREHRRKVRELIDAARPMGGTAYLDAAALGVEMLKGIDGRRAVLIMTDGVDMNSRRTLAEVIKLATVNQVPVYTLGIGELGKYKNVTTVLVLDHSGSMRGKADATDKHSKIEALRTAASRFVELMRRNAQTTLLPFSSEVEVPAPFSDDKRVLLRAHQAIAAGGRHAAVRCHLCRPGNARRRSIATAATPSSC